MDAMEKRIIFATTVRLKLLLMVMGRLFHLLNYLPMEASWKPKLKNLERKIRRGRDALFLFWL